MPYIIGHWEFYGLDFLLTTDVLIPRPETELIVERAIRWLQQHPHMRKVVDIGTGCGCIGIAIAKHIPDVQMLLTDSSAKALEVTRKNVEKHGLLERVECRQLNLLDRTPDGFDLVCANLPYIPTPTLEKLPVARSEPRSALDGGVRGIKVIRNLLKQAHGHLTPGGLLLLEIDASQGSAVTQLAVRYLAGASVCIWKDLASLDRCVEIETPFRIGHLCQRQEWLLSQARGEYHSDSLGIEGFIHCSLPNQLVEVGNRYYKDVADMVVLWIDPAKLKPEIHWEKSGSQYYPHVYGAINFDAVVSVVEPVRDNDGTFRIVPPYN